MPMNSTDQAVSSGAVSRPHRSPWRAILVWLVAVSFVGAVVAVPYAVVNSLRLERDAVVLRDAVTGAFAGNTITDGWSRTVEVRVGGCTLGLARLIAQCADLPVEARHALAAARSASVGVYQTRGADLESMRRRMSSHAEALRVGGREWVRLVSVRDGCESVVVLTPAGVNPDAERLELCVIVLADGDLVVVNLEVDPRPLADLVQPHLRNLRDQAQDAV